MTTCARQQGCITTYAAAAIRLICPDIGSLGQDATREERVAHLSPLPCGWVFGPSDGGWGHRRVELHEVPCVGVTLRPQGLTLRFLSVAARCAEEEVAPDALVGVVREAQRPEVCSQCLTLRNLREEPRHAALCSLTAYFLKQPAPDVVRCVFVCSDSGDGPFVPLLWPATYFDPRQYVPAFRADEDKAVSLLQGETRAQIIPQQRVRVDKREHRIETQHALALHPGGDAPQIE